MAAPIYHATGSKSKAFLASLGAGLAEPLGALIAWLVIYNVVDDIDEMLGIPFAVVSGIMVFVAIHTLLPAAQKYGKHNVVMNWLFIGMAVMAFSIVAVKAVLH